MPLSWLLFWEPPNSNLKRLAGAFIWSFFLWFGIETFNHYPSNMALLIQAYFSAVSHVGLSSYLKCTVSLWGLVLMSYRPYLIAFQTLHSTAGHVIIEVKSGLTDQQSVVLIEAHETWETVIYLQELWNGFAFAHAHSLTKLFSIVMLPCLAIPSFSKIYHSYY